MDSTTISNETANLIATLTEYLKSSVEFVKEQAPDVIRQVLEWEMAKAWITIGALLLLISGIVVVIFFVRKAHKRYKAKFDDGTYRYDPFGYIAGYVVCGVGMAICVAGCITQVYTIIQITIAPKVFLLQYLANLVK